MPTDDEIRGAVARGWCTEENKHKEMDVTLAEAITQEIILLLAEEFERNIKGTI